MTDPEARLFRKSAGTAATLCFMGHLLTENRNGLIVGAELATADGHAERGTAAAMLNRAPPRARRRTVGGDRDYDTRGFVADARAAGFTPHVVQNTTRRRSAIDERTTRKFLDLIDSEVPEGLKVHVVLDNSSTHKTPAIQRWLLRHPRFSFHFTPTYSSWMNLVERWFAELTTKWIRRGTHTSTKELTGSIQHWIDHWNHNPRPFTWHKSADEILHNPATYLQRIPDSGH